MRRPSQGPTAIANDIVVLGTMLRRAEADTKRPQADKKRLISSLKDAMSILLTGTRGESEGKTTAKKNGASVVK